MCTSACQIHYYFPTFQPSSSITTITPKQQFEERARDEICPLNIDLPRRPPRTRIALPNQRQFLQGSSVVYKYVQPSECFFDYPCSVRDRLLVRYIERDLQDLKFSSRRLDGVCFLSTASRPLAERAASTSPETPARAKANACCPTYPSTRACDQRNSAGKVALRSPLRRSIAG